MHLLRLLHILWVFARYRIHRLLPDDVRPAWISWLCALIPAHPDTRAHPQATHLRLALEKLGPVFIKFGQLLATRRELLSESLADDLAKLQDQVPPFDSALAVKIVQAAFKAPLDQYFARFDLEPLASASVAQVHSACLQDGSEVVVKIIRPDIRRPVRRDIQLMRLGARVLERLIPDLKRLHPRTIVAQYQQIIEGELDLQREAINTERFRQNFLHSDLLAVPRVYHDLTTQNVMTMERMRGVPVNALDQFKAAGVDLKALARKGITIFFMQVFRDNFFHADMHPGNIHVDISNPQNPKYIGLDCAIAGSLSEEDQVFLARQILALMRRDYDDLARWMIRAGWVSPQTPLYELSMTLQTICDPLVTRPLSEIRFGPLLVRLFQAACRFDMQSLPQLTLLEKTLLHVEGLGNQLDPELDIWAIGRPMLEQWMKQKVGPLALLHKARRHLEQFKEQRQTQIKLYQQLLQTQTQLLTNHSQERLLTLVGFGVLIGSIIFITQ